MIILVIGVVETRRASFELFVSEFVIAEISLGNPEAAKQRLDAIANIQMLATTIEVKVLVKALIFKGPIPEKAEIDAFHIAVAAVNGIEYLLT